VKRALLLALLLLLGAAPAVLADDELPQGWKTTVVGVLPVATVGTDVFDDGLPVVPKADADYWQARLDALLTRDQVELVSVDALRDRLRREPEVKRTLALAADRYDFGLQRWKALQAKEALGELDKARLLQHDVLAVLADRKASADVEFQRGVVLAELGDGEHARAAFSAALELDPTRKVAKGYYEVATEALIRAAQRDLIERPNKLQMLWPDDLLAQLAARLGVDVLALTLVEPDQTLRAVLWDARTRAPARNETIVATDRARAERTLDRAIAAWHACALTAEQRKVKPPPRPSWFADISYLHSVWLKHRQTRDFLQGLGAAIGVTYQASPGLDIFIRTAQIATLPDANADLLDLFTTTRLTIGAGLGVGSDTLRFSIRAGIDLQLSLSEITMTTDVNCKFFGVGSERCGSVFVDAAPTVWLGLDISLNLRWAPVRDFYFTFTAGNASYVLQPSSASELNFPLYGTIGFGLPL